MKRLLIIFTLSLIFTATAYCQCPDNSVCVTQDTLNKAAAAVDELKAARDVIGKFSIERNANEAERNAAQVLIKGLNQLLDTKDKIISEYERIQELYKQVITFQQQIIENLEKRLMKPESAWKKFIGILGKAVILLAGITLGRGI